MPDLTLGVFGEQFLELIQNLSNPVLDIYFGVVTTLGGTLSILIIIVLLYYTINKEFISKLIYFLVCSVYLCRVAKIISHNPRPYQFDSNSKLQRTLDKKQFRESGYSFSSEHA